MKRTRITATIVDDAKRYISEHPDARVEDIAVAVGISSSSVRRLMRGEYDGLTAPDEPREPVTAAEALKAVDGATAQDALDVINWACEMLIDIYDTDTCKAALIQAIALNIRNAASVIQYVRGLTVTDTARSTPQGVIPFSEIAGFES